MYNELKELQKMKIEIATTEDYIRVSNAYIYLNVLKNKVKDYWKEAKDKAYTAHKSIVAKEKEMLELIENKQSAIKIAISEYKKNDLDECENIKVPAEYGTLTIKKTKKYKLIDEQKVIEYLVKKKLLQFLEVNEKKFTDYMQLMGSKIPGVAEVDDITFIAKAKND